MNSTQDENYMRWWNEHGEMAEPRIEYCAWLAGRNFEAAQHHAHLTPESLASSQAVVNASALEQSDSVPPPAQAQVA